MWSATPWAAELQASLPASSPAAAVTPVTACLLLRVGAELVPEPFSPDALTVVRAALAAGAPLDGALELRCGATVLCRADFWDHLDGLLLAWLEAADGLAAGAPEAWLRFPDTGIEARCGLDAQGWLTVVYEDVDGAAPLEPLRAALEAAARRLVAALGAGDGALGGEQAHAPDAAGATRTPSHRPGNAVGLQRLARRALAWQDAANGAPSAAARPGCGDLG